MTGTSVQPPGQSELLGRIVKPATIKIRPILDINAALDLKDLMLSLFKAAITPMRSSQARVCKR